MPMIKKILNRSYRVISYILWNLFIVVILFLIIEFFLGIFVNWYYYSGNQINYEAFPNKTFGEKYFEEVNSIKSVYSPYVEYSREPNFSGEYVNIDENSLRKTINPCALKDGKNLKIFVFGGSTLWGTGARDAYTIPSLISKKFCDENVNVEVTNFGESGYENTKEVVRLELELRKGNIPDIVVFYDGVNEVYSAFQNGYAGAPQNLENRMVEFNRKDKLNLRGYIKYSDTMNVIRGVSKKLFKNKAVESGNTNNTKLSDEIVDIYFENIKIVKALEKEYRFKSYFFWQPIIYFDKPLTDGEKSVILENVRSLYENTYSNVLGKNEELGLYEISDVFQNTNEPVYIDFAHLNEKGNKIVAERIVEIVSEKEFLVNISTSNPIIVDGRVGKALKLDKETFVVIDKNNLDVIGKDDFSIGVWFKVDKEEDRIEDLIFKGGGIGKWVSFTSRSFMFNGALWFQFDDNERDSRDARGISNVRDGKWHHGVGVFERKANGWVIKVYVDGMLENITNLDNYGTLDSRHPIVLGRPHNGDPNNPAPKPNTYEYLGLVDEFRVYNRVLEKEEVVSSYQAGLNGLPSEVSDKDLLVYLSFDKIEGVNILDSSKNGNDGVFYSKIFL